MNVLCINTQYTAVNYLLRAHSCVPDLKKYALRISNKSTFYDKRGKGNLNCVGCRMYGKRWEKIGTDKWPKNVEFIYWLVYWRMLMMCTCLWPGGFVLCLNYCSYWIQFHLELTIEWCHGSTKVSLWETKFNFVISYEIYMLILRYVERFIEIWWYGAMLSGCMRTWRTTEVFNVYWIVFQLLRVNLACTKTLEFYLEDKITIMCHVD